MSFVWAMIVRNLRVEWNSPRSAFLRMVLQPATYLFVFGHVLGRMLRTEGGGDYAAVMAPGVMAISVMSAPYLVVGGAILAGFYFRTMEAWLLAPAPARGLLIALATSGVIYGTVSTAVVGLLVWIILGIAPQSFALPLFLCVAGSLFFSLLSVVVLLAPATPKRGQDLMSLVMMPMTYFGCTFYSFAMLARPFDFLALLLPTTYLSEGLRAAYSPAGSTLPASWVLAGVLGTTMVLIPIADRVVARRLQNFTW
jgi:ABC-2 type transport system permease protein